MISLTNEPLAKYTTLRIGGKADIMLQPENEEELISSIINCRKENARFRMLGNGSNLLISDKGVRGYVINNQDACTQLEYSDGVVYAGSSVKVQAFVRFCVKNNLGATEYLFSIPATIGGAVFMNAGRGKHVNQQISDHLLCVRIFNGSDIVEISKDDCEFSYRSSVFQRRRDWVILGAYFRPPFQEKQVGDSKVKERVTFVKETQDFNQRSAGSVFKSARHGIFRFVKGLRWGNAQYSSKATNWINNNGSAKASDVLTLIRIVTFMNLLTLKYPKIEIEYWD